MCFSRCFRRVVVLTGCAAVLATGFEFAQAQERNKELEKAIGIHHYNEKGFAIYDAFSHVNRIPNGPVGDFPEEPIDTAGRIFGRLANQEGRVEIKLPTGMNKDDYFAFKTFFSSDSFFYDRIGNCGACHGAGTFADGKKHVVTKGGSPIKTPTLRNLKRTDKELGNAIMTHIAASKAQKKGGAKDIDEMFALMSITEKDVPALVKFVKLLKDVTDAKDMAKVREKFRPLVNDARLVDVVGAKARGEVERRERK